MTGDEQLLHLGDADDAFLSEHSVYHGVVPHQRTCVRSGGARWSSLAPAFSITMALPRRTAFRATDTNSSGLRIVSAKIATAAVSGSERT